MSGQLFPALASTTKSTDEWVTYAIDICVCNYQSLPYAEYSYLRCVFSQKRRGAKGKEKGKRLLAFDRCQTLHYSIQMIHILYRQGLRIRSDLMIDDIR